MTTFDLITKPWLPVLWHDGHPDTISLADAFDHAHELVVAAPPGTGEPLLRLLLAVYDAAAGPRDRDEWNTAWHAPTLDTTTIGDYLHRWQHKFNLFDPVHPFAQCGHLDRSHRGPEALDPTSMASNTVAAWFGSIDPDTVHAPMAPGPAALALLTRIAVDPGGIKTGVTTAHKGKTYGAKAGAVGQVMHTAFVGSSLKATLLLNLPPQARAAGDTPAWERDCPIPGDGPRPGAIRAARGRLDWLTWPARLVRLQPDTDGNVIAVAWHDGDRLDGDLPPDYDPVSAWRPAAKRKGPGLIPDRSRDPYGDIAPWHPVGLFADTGRVCAAVAHVQTAIDDGTLPDTMPLTIESAQVVYNTHFTTITGQPHTLTRLGPVRIWRRDDTRGAIVHAAWIAETTNYRIQRRLTDEVRLAHLAFATRLPHDQTAWRAHIADVTAHLDAGDTITDPRELDWSGWVRGELIDALTALPHGGGKRAFTQPGHLLADIWDRWHKPRWAQWHHSEPTDDTRNPASAGRRGRTYTYDGDTKTIAEWANDPRSKVSHMTLRNRLAAGWTIADALTTVSARGRRGRTYTYDGDTKTIAEWANDPRSKVSHMTLRNRLAAGWTIADALTSPAGNTP